MAWGVGSSWTEHPFFRKYSAASSESSTLPPCPDPRISCFAPASKMCSASSNETLCDVPYFAFDSFFLRFFTLPLKRITTSCSYRSPDIVMLPNSVSSMDGFIGWPPFSLPTLHTQRRGQPHHRALRWLSSCEAPLSPRPLQWVVSSTLLDPM